MMGQIICGCFKRRVFEVLWDYLVQKEDHITVRQGDEVKLLHSVWNRKDMCTWVEVKLKTEEDEARGWINGAFIVEKQRIKDIPYIKDGRWYRGDVKNSNEAKEILISRTFPVGSFVVCRPKEIREAKGKEAEGKWPEYFMAVKTNLKPPRVSNYRIRRTQVGQYYIERIVFLSLFHLVCWYTLKRKLGTCKLRPDLIPERAREVGEAKEKSKIPAPPFNPVKCPRKKAKAKRQKLAGRISKPVLNIGSALNEDDKSELIDREKIHIFQPPLGSGHFATVYKATIPQEDGPVAVKELNVQDASVLQEFSNEIEIMKSLQEKEHLHIVRLVGCCVDTRPMIIMEFMPLGTLRALLQDRQESGTRIATDDIVDLLHQISLGMGHMEQCRIVHRDLAVRNILVTRMGTSEYLRVKISDFGLSRKIPEGEDFFTDDTSKDLPWRWMPLESIREGRFSSKSDVWSFGVVMFEIFSHGKEPYYYLVLDGSEDLEQFLEENKHMKVDQSLPAHWGHLQTKCFESAAEDRPTFQELAKVFTTFVFDTGILTNSVDVSASADHLVAEIVGIARLGMKKTEHAQDPFKSPISILKKKMRKGTREAAEFLLEKKFI